MKNTDEILKVRGLEIGGRVQKYIDNAILTKSAPYTPFRDGVLSGSGKRSTVIGSGEVRWVTPYARRLYYNPQYKFDGEPMRGAKWFERMKNASGKEIIAGAAKLAGGEAR